MLQSKFADPTAFGSQRPPTGPEPAQQPVAAPTIPSFTGTTNRELPKPRATPTAASTYKPQNTGYGPPGPFIQGARAVPGYASKINDAPGQSIFVKNLNQAKPINKTAINKTPVVKKEIAATETKPVVTQMVNNGQAWADHITKFLDGYMFADIQKAPIAAKTAFANPQQFQAVAPQNRMGNGPGQSIFGESLNEAKPINKTALSKRPAVRMVVAAAETKPVAPKQVRERTFGEMCGDVNRHLRGLRAPLMFTSKAVSAGRSAAVNPQVHIPQATAPQVVASKPTAKHAPAVKFEDNNSDSSDEETKGLSQKFAKLNLPTHATSTSSGVSNGIVRTTNIGAERANGAEVPEAPDNDSEVLSEETAEGWLRKVCQYMDSFPENTGKTFFTADELKIAARSVCTIMNNTDHANLRAGQDAFAATVAEFLNKLPQNPGNPVTKALILNLMRVNGGDYLDLLSRLTSLGVMAATTEVIFGVTGALHAAFDGVAAKSTGVSSKNAVPTAAAVLTTTVKKTSVTASIKTDTHAAKITATALTKKETPAAKSNANFETKPPQPPGFAPVSMAAWPSQMQRENRESPSHLL